MLGNCPTGDLQKNFYDLSMKDSPVFRTIKETASTLPFEVISVYAKV
jgi:hypothetical protein